MNMVYVRTLMIISMTIGLQCLVDAQLKRGYYAYRCPRAEKIVKGYTYRQISIAPALAASLLRMVYHDCFVRGCDASVLLNATKTTRQTEKTAPPNQFLAGYQLIDNVKRLVEAECPGVVSCADILNLMARDAIYTIGGPYWPVLTGRRDGKISRASEALANIPSSTSNLSSLWTSFSQRGLSLKDLVILSGAHTIGRSHCPSFRNRLYNFTGRGYGQDPSLDSEYASTLKWAGKCRSPNDITRTVEMDPGSYKTFDRSYYKLLLKRRGLFQSDAALTTGASAKAYVKGLANYPLTTFFYEFGQSMFKMSNVGVLTGSAGEIRKHCAFVNYY